MFHFFANYHIWTGFVTNNNQGALQPKNKHILKSIGSSIIINSRPETIWSNITNVNLAQFSDPAIFRLLGIPKPLKAEIISEGKGGRRIAYFENGKRFIQEILIWDPYNEYSFSFNPEKGFKVGYFFELSEGVFQIKTGAYYLAANGQATTLKLLTSYSIDRRLYFLFNIPARLILKLFQRYLLKSIKRNSE
jgi:hypothetical protein